MSSIFIQLELKICSGVFIYLVAALSLRCMFFNWGKQSGYKHRTCQVQISIIHMTNVGYVWQFTLRRLLEIPLLQNTDFVGAVWHVGLFKWGTESSLHKASTKPDLNFIQSRKTLYISMFTIDPKRNMWWMWRCFGASNCVSVLNKHS